MHLPRVRWSPAQDPPARVQDLYPALEGLLYAWAAQVGELPPVPISSAYQLPSRIPKANPRPSIQEQWVARRESILAVDAAVRRLPEPERTFVWLRYYYLARPGWIAKTLRLPRGRVDSIRHRALAMLAAQLLLRPDESPVGA